MKPTVTSQKCIIYIQSLDQNEYTSARYDQQGILPESIKMRSIDELRILQEGTSLTLIVLPTTWVSIHCIDLPKMKIKKIKEALLFSLEEQYAQPIDQLHVVFTQSASTQGRYHVFSLDRKKMLAITAHFKQSQIAFHAMTCDWFALSPKEIAVGPKQVLIHHESFKGSISDALAEVYLTKNTETYTGFLFHDSSDLIQNTFCTSHEEYFEEFILKRLIKNQYINFCQDEFQQRAQRNTSFYTPHSLLLGIGLGLIWILFSQVVHEYALSHELKRLQQENTQLTQQFFPSEPIAMTADFKTEVMRRLQHKEPPHLLFFTLLKEVSTALTHYPSIQLIQIEYHDEHLFLQLKMKDMLTLSTFEKAIKTDSLHIKQTQTTASKDQVQTTLEIFK